MMPNLRAGAGHDAPAGAAEAAAANRERMAVVSCMFGGEFEVMFRARDEELQLIRDERWEE